MDTADSADSGTPDSGELDTGEPDTAPPEETDTDTGEETADETGEDTATETGEDTAPEVVRDPVVYDMGTDADAKVLGEPAIQEGTFVVGRGGDVNGDGYADLVLGNYSAGSTYETMGRAYVVFGPISGTAMLTSADRHWEATDPSGLGVSIGTAGDMNGDGFDDLGIGEYAYQVEDEYHGRLAILYGPVSEATDIDVAVGASLIGEYGARNGCSSYTGRSFDAAGDINDDGYDDLVVAALDLADGCAGLGGGYVVSGPLLGDVDLETEAAARISDASYDGEIAGAGDTNGDGFDDVILGVATTLSARSAALLFLGPVNGELTRLDADTAFAQLSYGGVTSGPVGAGDVNADGYADMVLDDNGNSELFEFGGAVHLFYGPLALGEIDPATADATLWGPTEDATAGVGLDGPGDVNGDGFSDILVGAPARGGSDPPDAAYLVLGPVYGSLVLDGADVTFSGEGDGDAAGSTVAGAGDVDGDGLPDVLIGGYGDVDGGENAGAAWLFYAGNLW